jgi:predicted nuclease of predicted toxin-antitoxin system
VARTIPFHLDENCNRAVAEGLRRRGIDVTTTPEAGLLNANDQEQLSYAQGEGRVLFTHDRDFLRLHAAGVPHAGIVYCEKDSLSIGETVLGLVRIWECVESENMVNRVEYL